MSYVTLLARARSRLRKTTVSVVAMIMTAGVVVSVAPEAAATSITTSNWWPGNGNANDVAGAEHGTLTNGVTFTTGKFGQAFSFDGVDDHIAFGNVAGNVGSADFTLAFWLKTSSARREGIIGKRPECSHGSMFDVKLSAIGQVRVELDGNAEGLNYNPFGSTSAVNDGLFHHVGLVRKGTVASIYIDGRLEASRATAGVTEIANGAQLIAGKSRCTGVDGIAHFTGVLDEVVIGPDRDADGRPNTIDNCPDVVNGIQEDGDGDGIGDACAPPAPPSVSNLAPADGTSFITSSPTLSATFEDPNPRDRGSVEFEVYQDGILVASNAAGPSVAVQPGQMVAWRVPEGMLPGGRTYTWRARAFDGVHYSQWSSSSANRALSIGGTYPSVTQWTADEDNGRVDYSYKVAAAGLNAPGSSAGPCYHGGCSWRAEARYSDGTVQKNFGTIASGTLPHNTSSLSEVVSGTLWSEVTDVRTIVEPNYCSGCYASRTRYESGWTRVREPYRAGHIALTINNWERDPGSGSYTYDLGVSANGAAQFGGPCQEKACQWKVDALYDNGFINTLGSEQRPGGTWSFSKSISGTVSGGKVTHLKATLESMCAATSEYWCWDPYEAYTTGWIAVSNHVYKGQDLATADAALAPVLARNRTFFCTRFLLRAGSHHLRSSLTDQYIACEAAVGIGSSAIVPILKAILDAPGPAAVHDFAPEPFPAPDPSVVPPVNEDWEDETGCVQDISQASIGDRIIHVEERHGYESTAKVSRWGENVPWQLLVRPYALNHKAEPQPDHVGRCERVIQYFVPVGYEHIESTGEERLTRFYTVITEMGSSDFVTAFPGLPRRLQP